MKQVLFINSGFKLGGIETFLCRAAEKLNGKIRFKLLLMSDSFDYELKNKFEKYGDVFFLKDFLCFDSLNYAITRTISPLDREKIVELLDNVDVLHASCSFSLILMRRINKIMKFELKESVGVYHSRELLWGSDKYFMRRFHKKIFRDLPAGNVIFMNEFTRDKYSSVYNNKYLNTLPIGIDVDIYRDCIPSLENRRIVSIGRLVDFKTYNKLMILALSELNKDNNSHPWVFEVYGDGPELDRLKELASDLNVNVTFFGEVEYSKLPSIMHGASIFIGCGTAIVEAAAAGIPSIIGIESERDGFSHGFLSNTNSLSFQEKELNLEKYSYIELLSIIDKMNEMSYMSLSAAHRVRADMFSLNEMEKSLLAYYDGLQYSDDCSVTLKYVFSTFNWLLANKLKLINERQSMYDFQ